MSTSSLNIIRIHGGNLRKLHESFGDHFKKLQELTITNNKLTSLPNSIGNLQTLVSLFLFNNNITELPESVGGLKRLVTVSVENNRLKRLPKSIGRWQYLNSFYAWNNILDHLPDTVGEWKYVRTIDLRHNQLENLPHDANEWENIEFLYLAGNPMCVRHLNIPIQLQQAKGLCQKQCSVNCEDQWLGDGYCGDYDHAYESRRNVDPNIKPKPNSGCNTAACEYDKGDC